MGDLAWVVKVINATNKGQKRVLETFYVKTVKKMVNYIFYSKVKMNNEVNKIIYLTKYKSRKVRTFRREMTKYNTAAIR